MQNTLLIHGHSCCEIRGANHSLICDPWLLGSAYWRSWWNFPKAESIDKLLKIWQEKKELYIYLTHIHWDHFHGPTLRKIHKECKNVKFILPKVPENRFKDDLKDVIKNPNIIELIHARNFQLNEDLNILSFQSGPITSDSALAIFNKNFCVLNLNDSKILPLSMQHLTSLIPKPNITLRSHSSANSRCCKRDLAGKELKFADKTKFEYSKEFFNDCFNSGAKIAVPFASNMVHLHKETEKYNKKSNFSDYVERDFKKIKNLYPGMECKIILPSEQIDLKDFKIKKDEILRKKLFSEDRFKLIYEIKNKNIKKINDQIRIENKTKPSNIIICKFFESIIRKTPFILKIYFKDYIHIEALSKIKKQVYRLNFNSGKVELINSIDFKKNTVHIKVLAYVLNDICRTKNFNSLGISKRLEIRSNSYNYRYDIFDLLCGAIEISDLYSLRKSLNLRSIVIRLRRIRELFDLIFYTFQVIYLYKFK